MFDIWLHRTFACLFSDVNYLIGFNYYLTVQLSLSGKLIIQDYNLGFYKQLVVVQQLIRDFISVLLQLVLQKV